MGVEEAAAAEADYLRMVRLQHISRAGLQAVLQGDPAEVLLWMQSAARSGAPTAQLRLGQMLLDGDGTTRDEGRALRWFSKAAAQGLAEAMNMAGRCHENGWGTAVDLASAAHWYRASAEAGCDWGQYNYAHMLFDGCGGVAQDQPLALAWYLRAAEQGHARAMNLAARCYEEGWGTTCAPALAWDWYRRSAEAGYFRAQYNFATLLVAGGDLAAAAAWFRQACAGAGPDSLEVMIAGLLARPEPALRDLGLELRAART